MVAASNDDDSQEGGQPQGRREEGKGGEEEKNEKEERRRKEKEGRNWMMAKATMAVEMAQVKSIFFHCTISLHYAAQSFLLPQLKLTQDCANPTNIPIVKSILGLYLSSKFYVKSSFWLGLYPLVVCPVRASLESDRESLS